MKVTLHEVAARADVSIATVSRALNGLPVSTQSLERVRRAASELGYVANEAARSLRAERTMTMGLIFSDLRNTLGIELLDALSEAIESAGYSLLISTARGDAERYDLLMRRFLERRVDALFCIRPHGDSEALARSLAAGVPVMVLFGGDGVYANLPTLTPAFTEAAGELAERLRALGHHRLALLSHPRRHPPMAAIAETLKARGVQHELVEPSEAGGMSEVVARIMARAHRPTAILAPDPQVRGLVSACAAAGVRVPEDLSLVSVSEISADAFHRKHGVASVTIDPQQMGRASGAAMLAWLAGSPPAGRIRVQAAAFASRGSLGPAPSLP